MGALTQQIPRRARARARRYFERLAMNRASTPTRQSHTLAGASFWPGNIVLMLRQELKLALLKCPQRVPQK